MYYIILGEKRKKKTKKETPPKAVRSMENGIKMAKDFKVTPKIQIILIQLIVIVSW